MAAPCGLASLYVPSDRTCCCALARVARSCRMTACCCPHAASIWRRMHCVAPAPSRRCGRGASQVPIGAWLDAGRPAQPLVALGSVAESRLDLATARPRAGRARADARAFRVIGLADLAWRLARPCRQPSPSKRLISRSQAWAAVPCTADAHPTTTRMSRSATAWIGKAARGQLTGNSAWVDAPQALAHSMTISTMRIRTRRMTDSAADRSAARPRAASLAAGSPSCVSP